MIVTASNITQRSSSHFHISDPYKYCNELDLVISVAKSNGILIPNNYQLKYLNIAIEELKINKIWDRKDLIFLTGYNSELDFKGKTNPTLNLDSTNLKNFSLLNLKNPLIGNASFSPGSGDGLYTPFKEPRGFNRFTVTGDNGRIFINWIPENNGINWTQNNAGFSCYITSDSTTSASFINSVNTVTARTSLQFTPSNGTNTVISINSNATAANTTIANTNGSGFFVGERTASNLVTLYRNGTSIGTTTKTSQTMTSGQNVMLYGVNTNGTYSGGPIGTICSYLTMGASLGSSLQKIEYEIFTNLRTKLGYQ